MVYERGLTKQDRPKDLRQAIQESMFEPIYTDYLTELRAEVVPA